MGVWVWYKSVETEGAVLEVDSWRVSKILIVVSGVDREEGDGRVKRGETITYPRSRS